MGGFQANVILLIKTAHILPIILKCWRRISWILVNPWERKVTEGLQQADVTKNHRGRVVKSAGLSVCWEGGVPGSNPPLSHDIPLANRVLSA